MKRIKSTMLIAFVMLLMVPSGGMIVAEDQPASLTLSGDLIRVDSNTHTFLVRDAGQNETEFLYSDLTAVTGADKAIEELAGNTPSRVTVYYTKKGEQNIATKVEVHLS